MSLKEVDVNKPISVTITPVKPHLDIRTLQGPNVYVPFAAVVAEFTVPTAVTPPRSGTFPEVISAQLPDRMVSQIADFGLERSVRNGGRGVGAFAARLARSQQSTVADRPHIAKSRVGIFRISR